MTNTAKMKIFCDSKTGDIFITNFPNTYTCRGKPHEPNSANMQIPATSVFKLYITTYTP